MMLTARRGWFSTLGGILLLGMVLGSCHLPTIPPSFRGDLDLRGVDWSRGPVVLSGDWAFRGGWRHVPDSWTGNDGGGPDGRGAGTYQLRILVGENAPPLALRWASESTALAIRVNGVELARVGTPDPDPAKARSAYGPGTVRLPRDSLLTVEFFVSNHEYRVGGLWTAPQIGQADLIESSRWQEETGQVALAAALGIIGLATLLLFCFRRSEVSFLSLSIFAFLVALRTLVTGEYALVHILPNLPFHWLIRLEYVTTFLPLPAAVAFFSRFYPRLVPPWTFHALVWPSVAFLALPLAMPLDLMTRLILWYYPFSIPSIVFLAFVLVRRILQEGEHWLQLVGIVILGATALADTVAAALFTTTGTLVPWGLGVFVALQATSLAQRLLESYEATEAHLAEKELMVKEIHHRVKNSLQVVASLVTLQGNRVEGGPLKDIFHALRRRITAIALVHEKLHSRGLDSVTDIAGYLRELLRLQYPGDILQPGSLVWDIQATIQARVDFCIDVGLILTELVANSHKHGLLVQPGAKLQVHLALFQGRLVLEVTDDGPGFPPDFVPETCQGLGFRIIFATLARNHGSLSLPPGPGARVRVDLRIPGSG